MNNNDNTQGEIITQTSTDCADQPALKDVFKDDFHIGVALSQDQIYGNEPEAIAIAENHFNTNGYLFVRVR